MFKFVCSLDASLYRKGSGIQKKIAEALQDVNWGASSTTMNEIAEATFYEYIVESSNLSR